VELNRARTPPASLRIAFLSPRFWPETRRGAERFVRELADGLIADGHAPTLLTSHPGRPTRRTEDGLRIVRAWRPPGSLLVRRGFEDDSSHVAFSYAALRLGDYDLAQAVHTPDALAAIRWAKATRKPAIYSFMGIPALRYLEQRGRRLELTRKAVESADATVSLSETVAAAFREVFGLETRVIHPPVDVDSFTPGGERAERPTVFCAAAVDAPAKQVDVLVRAFALVRRERPDARLVLSDAGDPAVAARVAGDQDGVEFTNVDARPALAAAYQEAWVTALPSRGEAFGLVLTESLACGTPVVGSRLGAIPEVVDRDSIGRLFDGDERDLARAILEVLELAGDPATAEACRARAMAFSRASAVAAYEELYSELLAR
jgi:glycosyltransferase involved in cell wall biosynthesis